MRAKRCLVIASMLIPNVLATEYESAPEVELLDFIADWYDDSGNPIEPDMLESNAGVPTISNDEPPDADDASL